MIRWNNLTAALTEFGAALQERYKEELENKEINATKALSDSAQWRLDIDGDVFEVSLNLKEYWKYTEEGRRAGKYPPRLPIEKWITAKHILPRPDSRGKLPTLKQLTFLIQRSIAENGTYGQHPLENTVEDTWNRYERIISDAIGKDILEAVKL